MTLILHTPDGPRRLEVSPEDPTSPQCVSRLARDAGVPSAQAGAVGRLLAAAAELGAEVVTLETAGGSRG